MAHHKRRRHPNRRAGCALCKPWKKDGTATDNPRGESLSNHRRRKGIWDDAQRDLSGD